MYDREIHLAGLARMMSYDLMQDTGPDGVGACDGQSLGVAAAVDVSRTGDMATSVPSALPVAG